MPCSSFGTRAAPHPSLFSMVVRIVLKVSFAFWPVVKHQAEANAVLPVTGERPGVSVSS